MTAASATTATRRRRVLVVDDDEKVRLVVRLALEREQWAVEEADTVHGALATFTIAPPDLVVLDVGLGADSGLEVLWILRRDHPDLPVVMLTARGEEPDRVLGLQLGADDYLGKPFSPRELSARVEAVWRRSIRSVRNEVLRFGELEIDTASQEVRIDGKPVRLTAKEYSLLQFLATSPRRVFTKSQLLHHVWDSLPGWQTEATVTEHIHRLRRKIEADPRSPKRVVTVHGSGYRFDP